MANSNGKYKWNTNRLTYIEPNEYAGYNATKNNPDLPNGKQLSWNPEDLSMFVDLQVIIPRREDAGQESYKVRTDGTTVSMDSSLYARYVSYMGGTNLRDDNPKAETYITDNYTNISYQEVKGNKVVDKESLGIDSIDINFDAHFFPLVTMHFTDVRGSSLFMPSEEEFFQSVTNNDRKIEDTPSSFFKALFHFPYPRFLLSVKGFYGTKVTFQLAVSDFRSDFQPETGNYGITVKFIGYVYGLYTDLPFNLIMAAPYYNSEYWEEQKKQGVFKYVTTGGHAGGDMLTYIEFLSKMEAKDVDGEALHGADTAQSYLKTSAAVEALKQIPTIYKHLAQSDIVPDGNTKWVQKSYNNSKAFIWGRRTYTIDENDDVTSSNSGMHFDEETTTALYKAIQNIFKNYPEYISVVEDGNVFLQSFYKKKINDRYLTSDDIISDDELKHVKLFSYVSGSAPLTDYFDFYKPGDTIINEKGEETIYKVNNGNYFTIKGPNGNERFYNAMSDSFFQTLPNFKINYDLGEDLPQLNNTKIGDTTIEPLEYGSGLIVDIEGYCTNLENKIKELQDVMSGVEEQVAEELKLAYANIIGFEPTLENYYRMLFAHIDCFFDYYTNQILKQASDDFNGHRRQLDYLGITWQDTDLPKRFANDPTADLFPYPAYYTKHGQKQFKVADYPGYAGGKLSEIPEVDAVSKILDGIKKLRHDYNVNVLERGSVVSENVFSPLSILYNFSNPWNSIEMKMESDKDILHIIYYYICLIYADKVIGVDTNRKDKEGVTPYKEQMANLLYQAINGKVGSDFAESLRLMINTVKGGSGLKYLEEQLRPDYKFYQIFTSDKTNLKINPRVSNGRVAFKVTDDILTKPVDNVCGPMFYLDGSYNDPERNKNFIIGGATNDNPYARNRIQAFNDIWFLKDQSQDRLKDFNNKLIKIGESRNYLDEKLMKNYANVNENIFMNNSGDKGYIYLGDYAVGLLLDKPYKTDSTNEFVGYNEDDKIIFKTEVETHYYTSQSSAGAFNSSSSVTNITDYVDLKDTGFDTYTALTGFYESGVNDKHINFIGRKRSGKSTVDKDGAKSQSDTYTAVNLFSGVKLLKVGGNSLKHNMSDSDPEWILDSNFSLPPEELAEFKGLLYDVRCVPWDFKNDGIPGMAYEWSHYAFATYFLATLCGCGVLENITNVFEYNLKAGNKASYAVRKIDLLYLGGSLYFAKNGWNAWSDGASKKIIKDLINFDGTLSHGLLKEDDTIKNNHKEINTSLLFFEGIGDKLIEYFTEWCDNELFGGENMYDKLSKVVEEDNNEYITLNGYASCNNKISEELYSLVQGYKTGGECERWLTNLACSYEFAMTFYCKYDDVAYQINITQDDIVEFLEALYKPFKEEQDKIEERQRQLEEGNTAILSQDTKRATYYLLKNLYDKWLCTYTAEEFKLHTPEEDLEIRRNRFSKLDKNVQYSEYNNFIFVDQFYRDISSSFVVDSDLMAKTIKDIYTGRQNMDIYTFMTFMAEKNKLMLLALPVYTNMYSSSNVEQVFKPNTLYNMNDGDNCNGVGTTYVVMYTSQVSHKPGDFKEYDYDSDCPDIAGLAYDTGPLDLVLFNRSNSTNGDNLDYNVTAFAVSYGKQNQMYFKKVNVNMDNPKTTDEAIRNTLMLSEGGSQGDTNQPIAIGQNIYSIYSNRSYTCTVEMMGCMNIMPLMYFQLNNIPMFRGMYMIINVRHTIKAGDITTIFTGVRVNKYSMPDITDVMLNGSIFNKLRTGGSDVYREGEALTSERCDVAGGMEKLNEVMLVGDYPFKNVTPPYRCMRQYRVDNLKRSHYTLSVDNSFFGPTQYIDALNNPQSGSSTDWESLYNSKVGSVTQTSQNKNISSYHNPGNITVSVASSAQLGIKGTRTAGDGQKNYGIFTSLEAGIAGLINLLKNNTKYKNKSMVEINSSYQGIYKDSEPIQLSALRLGWVVSNCNILGIKPNVRFDMNNKYSILCLAYAITIKENSYKLSKSQLEDGYQFFLNNYS